MRKQMDQAPIDYEVVFVEPGILPGEWLVPARANFNREMDCPPYEVFTANTMFAAARAYWQANYEITIVEAENKNYESLGEAILAAPALPRPGSVLKVHTTVAIRKKGGEAWTILQPKVCITTTWHESVIANQTTYTVDHSSDLVKKEGTNDGSEQ